jgi:hypothetical protein
VDTVMGHSQLHNKPALCSGHSRTSCLSLSFLAHFTPWLLSTVSPTHYSLCVPPNHRRFAEHSTVGTWYISAYHPLIYTNNFQDASSRFQDFQLDFCAHNWHTMHVLKFITIRIHFILQRVAEHSWLGDHLWIFFGEHPHTEWNESEI